MNPLSEHCYPIVRRFREAFGISQVNAITHRQLWEEEQQEFYDANTPEDVADALGDMVFIWCGSMIDTGKPPVEHMSEDYFWRFISEQASMSGVNLKRAVEMIFDSNMSKLVRGFERAATFAQYNANGVSTDFRQVSADIYAGFVSQDCTDSNGRFYPANKLVKGVGFFGPKWAEDRSWIL